MSQFLQGDNDDAKALSIPWVFSENSRAKNQHLSTVTNESCSWKSGVGVGGGRCYCITVMHQTKRKSPILSNNRLKSQSRIVL